MVRRCLSDETSGSIPQMAALLLIQNLALFPALPRRVLSPDPSASPLAVFVSLSPFVILRSQIGILEHWDLSMDLFNARIKSPVRDWQVEVCRCVRSTPKSMNNILR